MNEQDWNESRMYVMKSIENTEASLKSIDQKLTEVQLEISNIKVDVAKKGSMWGTVSAVIVSLISHVLGFFGGGIHGG